MSSPLPEEFSPRPLAQEDAAAASELLDAFDTAHLAEVTDRLSAQDVLDWWLRHELERESLAVVDANGSLAAFGLIKDRADGVLELDAFVHPAFCGRGLGSFLLDWGEREGRLRGAERLRPTVVVGDSAGRALIESRRYGQVRSFYRMLIDLDAEPPAPEWPGGFSVATMRSGEERLLYEVMEDAFAEEWGHSHRPFEDWEQNVFGQASFDPELCFLVRSGNDVVAAEYCAQRFGIGWIGSIGVLKACRGRGLGRALLLHGFAELYRRGERQIGLGVDSQNPTGATQLYESVGMHVAWQADAYEKVL